MGGGERLESDRGWFAFTAEGNALLAPPSKVRLDGETDLDVGVCWFVVIRAGARVSLGWIVIRFAASARSYAASVRT